MKPLIETEMVARHASVGYSSIINEPEDALEIKTGAEDEHFTSSAINSSVGDTSINSFLHTLPGIMIAAILNLFLSISFGSAFFPTQWTFPANISRSIGVQMFLLSTVIAQIIMAFYSSFPCAMGMMMVENIPFMSTISLLAIQKQGMDTEDAFSTVFMANAIMSLSVGVAFLACGYYKAGYVLNVIPKSLILGCIGGIGIFIFKTGIEVSCNHPFSLTSVLGVWPYWGASIVFEVGLRLLQFYQASTGGSTSAALIPPLYFCSIPFAFYLILVALQIPVETAHSKSWFFPIESAESDYAAPFRLLDVRKVDWSVIVSSIPTMIASTIFAFLHVPLNVPALKMTSGCDVDINKELTAHGYSNILAAISGQCQNYLCYSNSVLYLKCNGKGRVANLTVAALSLLFFFQGTGIISYVPRCMPGCLLIHIGIDLTREALYDSLAGFDWLEYCIIVALSVIMTFWGMTEGLIVGVIAAAVAFIFQTNLYINPIRRQSRCTNLKSSKWRSARAVRLLPPLLKRVIWVQLQGSLFFGNSQVLATELEKSIAQYNAASDSNAGSASSVLMVILDFTLVLGIDSSAVDAIKDLAKVGNKHRIDVVYVRGSKQGFPCTSSLTESLLHQSLHVVDELNDGIALCEDFLLSTQTDLRANKKEIDFQAFLQDSPIHLYQLLHICPNPRAVSDLMSHFVSREISADTVLWTQGDQSSSAVLLQSGRLRSYTTDCELMVQDDIRAGHLVGEFGLIKVSKLTLILIHRLTTSTICTSTGRSQNIYASRRG